MSATTATMVDTALSLHPEHRADLQRSGLSEATIEALNIHSARPGDISKVVGFDPPGVTSAMVFPYPDENGFARVKVFPTYTDKKGHTVKYLQKPGTGVKLYAPPLAARVLTDPTMMLMYTEGEKKAAKANQEGIVCVGIGGLWNWTDNGHPIPKFDEIAHADREEIIGPDSDVWHRPDLLRPVYALGKELEQRGAKVTVVIIPPDPDGRKRGLDDYLVACERDGMSATDALARLKRLPLKHAAFSHAAEWWKNWSKTRAGDGATDEADSQPVVLADPDPWPTPVDGADLLTAIEKTLTRFVILPRDAFIAIALWVLHAHVLKAFSLSPILAVLSPTMRCGKSTLLSLLAVLLPRALSTSNITPAALFRSLERYKPCLLVDEGDAFLTLSEELRGILNSGHTRSGASVIRTVGDDFEPKIFSTWGAKVLAAIGKLPPTVMDRSIVIAMQRKAPGESVERFRQSKLTELTPLCQQSARWAADNLAVLRDAEPSVPGQLNDRAADNWRPLLAIADLIGGEWPTRAREAALTLSGETVQEESHHGVTLIGDIVAIFEARDTDRLSTTDIIADLVKLEERPWSEWRHGKPITPRGVASLLRPFKIKPKVQRIGPDTSSGYEQHMFIEAHTRYFPGSYPKHCQQSNEYHDLDPISDPQQDPHVKDTKSDLTIEKHSNVKDVKDRNPENEAEAGYGPDFDTREPVAWETL
ncbi:MAG: DUF3631 domain-containing protein [bacterium]|uniref:DUF3631 domain-containing protein n=1 Tax=Candidatus Methylomirabilis tolerans TaxID=3123416 RepID=A0AAJ1EK97_9BACT|nr:DUF3631 domain-containing protein [Candidatus Methylomirabilis sp.]